MRAPLFFLLSLCCVAPQAADRSQWLDWSTNYQYVRGAGFSRCAITQAMAAQWETELRRIAEAFGEMAGTPPDGMYLQLGGTFMPPEDTRVRCGGSPMTGTIDIALWRAQDVRRDPVRGKPGQFRMGAHGETAFIYIDVNRYRNQDHESWMDDQEPAAPLQIIRQTGSIQGFPILNDTVLVITPPGRSPAYVPAPLGRSLRAWIAYLDKEVKAMQRVHKPGEDPISDRLIAGYQQRLERAQALLSSLDATGQAGPAYWGTSMVSEVVAEPGDKAQPLMIPNPAYFNPALPRSVPQLLQVQVQRFDLSRPASNTRNGPLDAERAMIEGADWHQIAAMLK